MRLPRTASTLLLLALPVAVRPAPAAVPALAPDVQAALVAYLKDPAGSAEWFLDTARAQSGPLHPGHAALLGDAALRTGRYRVATAYFESVRDSGEGPSVLGAAEIGLAWTALGRGRLDDASEHFANAGTLNEQLRSFTDFAGALLAAADGDPGGQAALAAAVAGAGLDPRLRELQPLLDAYVRLWAGDAAGAADGFTAFAVAHPDSRFTDDALYAAAQAKEESGRDAEAQADLEALAGDQRVQGRLSSRLVALDGKALLREGMRRDRDLATRLMPQRIADLLDGDGGRLARAALAAREHPAIAGEGQVATGRTARRTGGGAAWFGHAWEGDVAHPGNAVGTASRRETSSGTTAGAAAGDAPARAPRFPWTVLLAAAALLAVVALWVLARERPSQAGSR